MSFGISSSSSSPFVRSFSASPALFGTTMIDDKQQQQKVPTAPPSNILQLTDNAKLMTTCNATNCPWSQKILVCYTPRNQNQIETNNNDNGEIISCVTERNVDKLVFTMDPRAAIVPNGAIIDSIEFFGNDGFSTKDVFGIGLGQMNHDISFPLIVECDTSIANERAGGSREFLSYRSDGRNSKIMVANDSYVNVDLSHPITSGYLQIVIRYHNKIGGGGLYPTLK